MFEVECGTFTSFVFLRNDKNDKNDKKLSKVKRQKTIECLSLGVGILLYFLILNKK